MKNVYTVGQVNAYIRNMFAQDFMLNAIYVKGEASNVKYHSSGHLYFTLKDIKGSMACVMFAGSRKGLSFQLKDGQQIIVGGTVDVYERDGKYQLYAREIVPDGAGRLYEQFERLKAELLEMGMFDRSFKQPVPRFVRTLGVVTAPTGAAVRDIIHIATRRNPHIRIILYPAKVQGDGAAESIVCGIRALEELGVDVIIAGRGGGSIEDLWAFNEEIVARAIFDCAVPVISAVGHETDTTIADFAADLRAPTPSAAAELSVLDYIEFENQLADYRSTLNHLMRRKLSDQKAALERQRMRLNFLSPESRVREKRTLAAELNERLQNQMGRVLERKRHAFEIYLQRLEGLSPIRKLGQGFAAVYGGDGRRIADVDQAGIGDLLAVHMKNGVLKARVEEKEKIRREPYGGKDSES